MRADRYYAEVADSNIVAIDLPQVAKPEIFGTTLGIEDGTGNARNKPKARSTSLIFQTRGFIDQVDYIKVNTPSASFMSGA
jgi:hypothetical protein